MIKRYLVVMKEDGEIICSLDTETGEGLVQNGYVIKTDDYEDVIDLTGDKPRHVCFDH